MLTTREFAKIAGCSSQHVQRLCRQKKLAAIKLGRDWALYPQAIEDFENLNHQSGNPEWIKPAKEDEQCLIQGSTGQP